MQSSSTCSRCSGTGQIVDNKPSGVDANGMISKEEFDAKDFSLRKRLELKNSKENKVKRKKFLSFSIVVTY